MISKVFIAAASEIIHALASTVPTVTGCKASCKTRRHFLSLNFDQPLITNTVIRDDGKNLAVDVTNSPDNPATCHPTKGTIIIFGPGAACAMANNALNSCAVIQ
ncbi:Uncharacterised protein [Acinetobacter baumannii]|nr:Uncharacterised protein [Acinetobacter baumannii]